MSDKFEDFNIYDRNHKKIGSVPAEGTNKSFQQGTVYDSKGKPIVYVNREESNTRVHHLGDLLAPVYIESKHSPSPTERKYIKKDLSSGSSAGRTLVYLCCLGFFCYLICTFLLNVYNGHDRNLSNNMSVLVSALTASGIIMLLPILDMELLLPAYMLGDIAGAVVTVIFNVADKVGPVSVLGILGTFILSCLENALIMLPVLLMSFICVFLRRKMLYELSSK